MIVFEVVTDFNKKPSPLNGCLLFDFFFKLTMLNTQKYFSNKGSIVNDSYKRVIQNGIYYFIKEKITYFKISMIG